MSTENFAHFHIAQSIKDWINCTRALADEIMRDWLRGFYCIISQETNRECTGTLIFRELNIYWNMKININIFSIHQNMKINIDIFSIYQNLKNNIDIFSIYIETKKSISIFFRYINIFLIYRFSFDILLFFYISIFLWYIKTWKFMSWTHT